MTSFFDRLVTLALLLMVAVRLIKKLVYYMVSGPCLDRDNLPSLTKASVRPAIALFRRRDLASQVRYM